MPITELDELFGTLSTAEDRAALEAILERNSGAKTALIGQTELYKAFVSGSDDDVAKLADKHKPARTVVDPVTPPAATTDIAALESRIFSRFDSKFGESMQSKTFTDAIAASVKAAIEEVRPAFESDLLGKAAKTSDSVYHVRRMHEKEFGAELDTAKFDEFLTANPGKFASIEKAHDAFVYDDRIKAQIAKGVQDELRSREVANLPGSALPANNQSVLAGMIRSNASITAPPVTAGGVTPVDRGAALDAAARAFAGLRRGNA